MARHWPCFRRRNSSQARAMISSIRRSMFRQPRVSSTEICQLPRTASHRRPQSFTNHHVLPLAKYAKAERTMKARYEAHSPLSQTRMPNPIARSRHNHHQAPCQMASLTVLLRLKNTGLFRRIRLLLRGPRLQSKRKSIFAAVLS